MNAILIFIILHILVYPSSNGYNSFMDRDSTPIGGLKAPMKPTPQLFAVTVAMDLAAICLSFLVSAIFAAGIALYILASRAYSYRKIRLKQYPVIGYLTVIFFQGAVTFFLVYHGSDSLHTLQIPASALIASSLLIGGFYPLTQIYQHEADYSDGVITISYVLKYNGTFIFTGIVYVLAFLALGWYFYVNSTLMSFFIL